MRQHIQRLGVLTVAIAGLTVGTVVAKQSQTTETRKIEIVAVDGNKVVVKDAAGTREYTVPPDFKMTVDGKPVTVAELKPGMAGTATVTTTTTVKPVTVTEVKSGEVMQATGNSLMVKTEGGIRMFTPGDIEKRNIKIMKDGKPVDFSSLHAGDRLSATIITEHPPQIITERQAQANLSSPAAATGTGAAAGKVAASPGAGSTGGAAGAPRASGTSGAGAAAGGGDASATAKKLPKTASTVPLTALVGLLALAGALALGRVRRA